MDFSKHIAEKIITEAKLKQGNLVSNVYREFRKVSIYITEFMEKEREREREKEKCKVKEAKK